MYRRPLPLLLGFALWAFATNLVYAQRVQVPSAAPTYGAPTTSYPTYAPTAQPTLPGPGMSSFDPYGNPLLGTPPADVPYSVTPQASAPILPQNPNSVLGPPVPQQGGSLFPQGLPYQWESGVYQYQNTDGQFARLQRLMQQISFEHTWLHGEQKLDELEINRSEVSATFAFPIFYNPDTPLLVTPGFAATWLGGPINPGADLPPRVYDAYLDTAWHPQLTDWLSADLGLRTGVWTDFDNVSSDSIRILGRGLGVLALTPKFDVLVGVWYLDRNRIKLLPAGGAHWRPSADWDIYAVFPNPKVRRRSINIGTCQLWIYLAGEYGGGRWTVERLGGDDDIDYNDIRLIYGVEWETQTQVRGHIEIGYVFDREVLYDRTAAPPKLNLDDTLMVRAGIDF